MSLNSLKIASDGYLKRTTKVALIIAVSGYLNYADTTPPVPPVEHPSTEVYKETHQTPHLTWDDETTTKEKQDALLNKRKQIIIEDSEIVAIVEYTLKNFTF